MYYNMVVGFYSLLPYFYLRAGNIVMSLIKYTGNETDLSYDNFNADNIRLFNVTIRQDYSIVKHYSCKVLTISRLDNIVTILGVVVHGSASEDRSTNARIVINNTTYPQFKCIIGELSDGSKRIKQTHIFCQIEV